jgi:triosephosphate isomerase
MRRLFIAGNWKMNTDAAGASALAGDLLNQLGVCQGADKVDVALCPPYVYLSLVAQKLKGSFIGLGAQNGYFAPSGALTGEISMAMLKDVGCRYVILGHSERRHIMGETDEIVNKKLLAALAGGLDPIFCIGELLEQRKGNKTEAVLETQLRQGLAKIDKGQMARVTIAYEPVWAIGTGQTATPQQAQDAHKFVRKIICDLFDNGLAQSIRIQYGGSVKPDNAKELMGQPDVDGALVGGASLKVEDFMGIIKGGISGGSGGSCRCNCHCS